MPPRQSSRPRLQDGCWAGDSVVVLHCDSPSVFAFRAWVLSTADWTSKFGSFSAGGKARPAAPAAAEPRVLSRVSRVLAGPATSDGQGWEGSWRRSLPWVQVEEGARDMEAGAWQPDPLPLPEEPRGVSGALEGCTAAGGAEVAPASGSWELLGGQGLLQEPCVSLTHSSRQAFRRGRCCPALIYSCVLQLLPPGAVGRGMEGLFG